jgi:hypothetical protein
VVDQMRNLGGIQQRGLARHPDVAAKGGWGPEADGGYVVRQIALVGNGTGSFETGKSILDALGSWLDSRRNDIVGDHC